MKIHPSKMTFIILMGSKGWLPFNDPQNIPGLSRDIQKLTTSVVSVTVNCCNRQDGSHAMGIKETRESRERSVQNLPGDN